MADDTKKPTETGSATPATSTSTAASAKPPAAKPAARPRAAKAAAKPASKRVPASAKTTTTAAKKTLARPPVAKKTPPAKKKGTHEPKPFVAQDNKQVKPAKAKKVKLVRDSFTMPEAEYALIATLKKRCLDAGVSAKKSEILRAAVASLAKLGDASMVAAVRRLEVIKTGRPAKGSK